MAKSLCHLLVKVNYVIVVNFYVANMSFNTICENKIVAKNSSLQYHVYDFRAKKSNLDFW